MFGYSDRCSDLHGLEYARVNKFISGSSPDTKNVRYFFYCRRIGAYLRKMAIDGYIIYVDTRDIKEMNKLLSAIGRNINQIAKRVNAGGPTYQADMEEIRERLDQIWQLQRRILLSQR